MYITIEPPIPPSPPIIKNKITGEVYETEGVTFRYVFWYAVCVYIKGENEI